MSKDNVASGFNKQVTYRDEQSGVITHVDPYILRVTQNSDGGKTRTWERPAGSGNLFDNKGNAIGRLVSSEKIDDKSGKKIVVKKYDASAEHVSFAAPLTSDQKLARAVVEKDARISELEKQIAGIKAESDKKKKA